MQDNTVEYLVSYLLLVAKFCLLLADEEELNDPKFGRQN